MRASFLPFALPDTDETEIREVTDTIRSGWITTGLKAKRFEEAFAAAVGASHAVAVNSGTAAMHLALEAVGLKAGDEVITTPYTFAATAEVIRYFNASPVFVDCIPETLHINPALIERAVTKRTRAIIPVHLAGLPSDMDAILALARQHDLRIIEDAAHSFPCMYRGRPIGAIGDFTCFSFYATKPITTGEGGMICTDNQEWADRCRVMALHGISKDAWKRYTAEGSWFYEIVAPGYKYNMTDVAAAMGLAQLAKADAMWKRRGGIAEQYNRAFADIPELQTPSTLADCTHSWHLYMLRLNLDRLTIDRSGFIAKLKKANIGASVHFIPLHIHPYYRDTYRYQPEDYPVAYREYLREISLPIYSRMSDSDIVDVYGAVLDIIKRHRR